MVHTSCVRSPWIAFICSHSALQSIYFFRRNISVHSLSRYKWKMGWYKEPSFRQDFWSPSASLASSRRGSRSLFQGSGFGVRGQELGLIEFGIGGFDSGQTPADGRGSSARWIMTLSSKVNLPHASILGPYVVQTWSRYVHNYAPAKPAQVHSAGRPR